MSEMFPVVGPIDPLDATENDLAALNVLSNILQRERLPKEPDIPLEQTIRDVRAIPRFVEVQAWMMWNADHSALVAESHAAILLTEENQHVAQVELGVHPEWRRQGIATALLRRITEAAEAKGRRLLIGNAYASVPSGATFAQRIGASPGLVQTMNELDLKELDRDLLRRWQNRARERATDFRLGVWKGQYPEDELERVAALFESVNLMPREDLNVEDFHYTAEQVREFDRSLADRGAERWTLYAEDLATRQIAGFTEVIWNPTKPDLMDQGGTAVFPQYQNRGLGRWLKAEMLELVLRDRPQVTRIHTGNANSNAPMLSINRELGFKPYSEETVWQVETTRVHEYLQTASAPALSHQ